MALDELGVLAGDLRRAGRAVRELALYLIPYLIAGHDVLLKAWRNIRRGEAFDESFLMAVATIGAFAMICFPEAEPHMAEGAAVMLFYQVGELFQSYAVGKSRKSIAAMMDIAPDYANIERDGAIVKVGPDEVPVGDRSWSSPASVCRSTASSSTAPRSSTQPPLPASPCRVTSRWAARSSRAAST